MSNTKLYTDNYELPLYVDSAQPDLSNEYVKAMEIIDTQMKTNATAAADAAGDAANAQAEAEEAKALVAQADSDTTITVEQLAGAKVNANGYVYIGA